MKQNPFVLKKTLVALYGIALGVSLIQVDIGLGFIFGLTASIMHQFLFAMYVDTLMFNEKFSIIGFILGYVLRFMVLVFAMASAVLWPTFINIIGVIFGLFVLKLLLYVKELSFKKGENR